MVKNNQVNDNVNTAVAMVEKTKAMRLKPRGRGYQEITKEPEIKEIPLGK